MIPPEYKVIGYTINYVEDDQDLKCGWFPYLIYSSHL